MQSGPDAAGMVLLSFVLCGTELGAGRDARLLPHAAVRPAATGAHYRRVLAWEGRRRPLGQTQGMRTGRLSAVVAPAALRAVTLHRTLRPRSLLVMRSVLRCAPGLRLPFTSQR
jgi:hypothetical protein